MDFPEVAACCADRQLLSMIPPYLLAVVIPSSAKKYIIRYPAMDFQKLAARGIGW